MGEVMCHFGEGPEKNPSGMWQSVLHCLPTSMDPCLCHFLVFLTPEPLYLTETTTTHSYGNAPWKTPRDFQKCSGDSSFSSRQAAWCLITSMASLPFFCLAGRIVWVCIIVSQIITTFAKIKKMFYKIKVNYIVF